MTTLPTFPFELHGGCFCNAIRYTISIPELSARPIIPHRSKTPFGPENEVNERLPLISIDHCNSCRRVSGSVLQSWLICPQAWVEFSLEAQSQDAEVMKPTIRDILTPSQDLQECTFITGFSSSEHASRTFCGRCGTHLTFYYSGPNQAVAEEGKWGPYCDIVVGSLDKGSAEMEGLRPSRQVWPRDGIEWVKRLVAEADFGDPETWVFLLG
ncbi:hypothetical protein BDZ45DRAFT_807477 [Acephala macrosclerotiorum]|nr:hypothetical protein BDZ45DRAFT_807477 [Acephala macrosclerotiorum]